MQSSPLVTTPRRHCVGGVRTDSRGDRYLADCRAALSNEASHTTRDHHCPEHTKRCYLPKESQWLCTRKVSEWEYSSCRRMPRHLKKYHSVMQAHDLESAHRVPHSGWFCESTKEPATGDVCRSVAGWRESGRSFASAGPSSAANQTTLVVPSNAASPPPPASPPTQEGGGAPVVHTPPVEVPAPLVAPSPPPSVGVARPGGGGATTTTAEEEAASAPRPIADHHRCEEPHALCDHALRAWRGDRGFVGAYYDGARNTCYATYDRRAMGGKRLRSCGSSFGWAHDDVAAARLLPADRVADHCVRTLNPDELGVREKDASACLTVGGDGNSVLCPALR